MSIKRFIGDYEFFCSDLFNRIKSLGINIVGMRMSHLTYRTETGPEYIYLRDQLKFYCKEFVETQFNGRSVSILELEESLKLKQDFRVSIIELAAPRPVHMYPSGLESLGVILQDSLDEFKIQNGRLLTGVKDHGEFCQPAFVTFDNGKSFKFYDISLREIVILQGWEFAKIDKMSVL